ncbi:hypothetical protein [Bilophila wadsworthia]|uniref:hypothetical protein n=1 Tax=Bilophila wadsworthia TaxID=35833 RepID=UPI0035205228
MKPTSSASPSPRSSGTRFDENASYRTAAIAATGEAFPALVPAPEPEAEDTPGRILLDRCHAAFNREPTSYRSDELFQHLLDIAQQELQSERAALFRPTDDGRPEFVASVKPHPHGAGKRRDAELYGVAGKHPPQCRLHPQ